MAKKTTTKYLIYEANTMDLRLVVSLAKERDFAYAIDFINHGLGLPNPNFYVEVVTETREEYKDGDLKA